MALYALSPSRGAVVWMGSCLRERHRTTYKLNHSRSTNQCVLNPSASIGPKKKFGGKAHLIIIRALKEIEVLAHLVYRHCKSVVCSLAGGCATFYPLKFLSSTKPNDSGHEITIFVPTGWYRKIILIYYWLVNGKMLVLCQKLSVMVEQNALFTTRLALYLLYLPGRL